jgi:hypothetical protein
MHSGSPRLGPRWRSAATGTLHAVDVLLSVVLIPFANWFVLLVAALAEGSKPETCFQRCTPPRHVDGWTPIIFLPVILLAAAVVALVAARSRWMVWHLLRSAAAVSLVVVAIVLAVHIDALSSVPPWHWLDLFRTSSIGG